MGIYQSDEDYDLVIAVFDARIKADQFYDVMRSHEELGSFSIKEAATFTREENGKIRLNNRGYIAGWKGGSIGLGIGIILGGPVGGAVVGGLVGFLRSKDRRELREKLDADLSVTGSAIALMLTDPVDWDLLKKVGGAFDAELVHAELRGESMARVEELVDDEDVQDAVGEEFDEIVTD